MGEEQPFSELLKRIANQDEAAMNAFISRYEPELRVIARSWLRPCNDRLRAVVDSHDICQSVLAWFLLRDGAKRYDLESPEDLRRLLTVVTRNRVFQHARKMRTPGVGEDIVAAIPSNAASPEQDAEAKELAEMIETRLTPEEADLARRRIAGATWDDIAAAVGGTPDSRRMQLARAIRKLVASDPHSP